MFPELCVTEVCFGWGVPCHTSDPLTLQYRMPYTIRTLKSLLLCRMPYVTRAMQC
jgi:hypothetical protein